MEDTQSWYRKLNKTNENHLIKLLSTYYMLGTTGNVMGKEIIQVKGYHFPSLLKTLGWLLSSSEQKSKVIMAYLGVSC